MSLESEIEAYAKRFCKTKSLKYLSHKYYVYLERPLRITVEDGTGRYEIATYFITQHRRIRFIPFLSLDKKEWNCTLVIEWLRDGKVYLDDRHVMSKDEFDQMKEAMLVADNSEL